MSFSLTALGLATVLCGGPVAAQIPAPQPRDRRDPPAGPVRLPDGRTGPGYWQQQVDYSVEATLLPATHRLTGSERITYHNNSPDTLRELYWHLYQNLFRPLAEARRTARMVGPRPPPTHGITVFRVEADSQELIRQVDRTLMRTPLRRPLPPGASLRLHVTWEYEVPTTEVDLRTGRDGDDYGMAQWYPQIAVYDDRGWDAKPYLGQGEFYLEYGDWDVHLRVPADYVVAATGMLQNPAAVLRPEEIRRLEQASADSVVHVISAVEPRRFRRRAARTAATWHFAAQNVRDFVWSASPSYLWDATRLPGGPASPAGALVYTFYHPRERVGWGSAAAVARETMELYGDRLGAYPYPQVTAVSGPVTGMEYPMLVFGNRGSALLNEPARVLVHELGHQWFPMVVGSDENRYALMDEGFVTFMTAVALQAEFGQDALLSPRLPGMARHLAPVVDERLLDQTIYLLAARAGLDIPMLTPSDQIPVHLYDVAAYMKPGTVLYMLRDVLGRQTFLAALRGYYERWRYRHPEPDDFFNTVENIAGRDLDWFWDEWFRQTWTIDLAVYDVRQQPGPGGWSAALELANLGRAVMPATVRLQLENGQTRDVRVPESVWNGILEYTFIVDSLPARVHSAEVDPDLILPDVDRMNNRWPFQRIETDGRAGLLVDLLPPLNAYRVGLSPSVWYARASGGQIGLSTTGSYLGTDHRVSLAFRIGTRNGRLDGRFRYSDPLYGWGPGSGWWGEAFRLEGRLGAGFGIDLAPGQWSGLISGQEANTRLHLALRALSLQDPAYLPDTREWASGLLIYGTADASRLFRGPFGEAGVAGHFEAGGPGSDWSYGRGQVEGRIDLPLFAGLHLLARGVGGNASGHLPPQSAFNAAEASAVERFHNQLFRSRGALEAISLADNALLGGGGAIPGADPTRLGTRLAAANLVLQRGPFELFADAGDAWRYRGTARWTYDAGVGAGVDLDAGQGPIRLLRWRMHLRAPLWVRDPLDPARSGWGFRWRVVFGGRWGD